MHKANMPSCICGRHEYQQGGGSFSPGRSTIWFNCSCGRPSLVIYQSGGLVITPREIPEMTEYGEFEWPADAKSWLDKTLTVYLRAHQEQADAERSRREREIWDGVCALFDVPPGTKYKEHRHTDPADETSELLRVFVKPDGTEITDQSFLKGLDAVYEERVRALPWAGDLVSMGIPPQVPDSLIVHVYRHDSGKEAVKFQRVIPEESALAPVPTDPVRDRHDKMFNGLFAALEEAGFSLDPVEIPNRYYRDVTNSEPWYRFEYFGQEFVLGPRKRVISLTVSSPEKRFSTQHIAALAARDDVTFEVDGRYKSDAPTAAEVTVHAWGMEKALEYMIALLKAV